MKFVVLFSALLFSFSFLNAQTVIYVDKDANEGGNGITWSSFKYLNNALDHIENNGFDYIGSEVNNIVYIEIWIAEGIYYPDEGSKYSNDDTISKFNLETPIRPSNHNNIQFDIKLIGGFKGLETSSVDSDPITNKVILSNLIFEEYGILELGSNRALYINGDFLNVSIEALILQELQ